MKSKQKNLFERRRGFEIGAMEVVITVWNRYGRKRGHTISLPVQRMEVAKDGRVIIYPTGGVS